MTSSEPFALKLQLLASALEQVLVLAELIGQRNEDGRFSTSSIKDAFDDFRIPSPSNISDRLTALAKKGLVVRLGGAVPWAITPLGSKKVLEVVGSIKESAVDAQLDAIAGAEFGHARHSVIPAVLAPQKWVDPIRRLLDEFPFDQNVFLMTRYPGSETEGGGLDPLDASISVIRESLNDHHLSLHMAKDQQLDDDLLGNVAAHMWACRYGIGILENRAGKGLNYNVVIELGAMLMTGRRCAFIRDTVTSPDVPSDFVGQLYKPLDLEDLDSLRSTIHRWVAHDLGLGSCANCG